MLSQKELSEVSKLLEDFSPPVTFYERDSLVPQMRNRLNYIIEIFEEFIEICKEPGLADRINGAVAVLGNSEFAKKANYTPPVVGREYLDGVIRVCETQFIGDIKEILEKHPLDSTLSSIKNVGNFLNDAGHIFRSIHSTKESPFTLALRTQVSIREPSTGSELVPSTQPMYELIMVPFRTRLAELEKVCETSFLSIDDWSAHIRGSRSKQMDLMSQLAQLKTTKTAIHQNWMAIGFTLVLTLCAIYITDRIGLSIKNSELEQANQRAQAQISNAENELDTLKVRLRDIEAELNQANQKIQSSEKPVIKPKP